MPIHDLGYRAWPGSYSSDLFRFWVIAASGIRVVGRNTWVRRVLFAAWLPTFGLAAVIFGCERLVENRAVALTAPEARGSVLGELGDGLSVADVVVEALTKADLREGRHLMWSWLLSTFLRVPQAVMATLVIGMIASPSIARDVRTRAFLIYFSKPIGRIEYILGKMTVVSTYLIFITTVPALGCYLFGVALSSDLGVLADTWDLPFRIVLASVVFIIPTVSVALMFSSLTSETRFAAFAWFAFWGLGFIAWNVTYGVMSGDARRTVYTEHADPRSHHDPLQWIDEAVERGLVDQRQIEAQIAQVQEEIANHPMSLVSMYDTLVRLQRWVFGLERQRSAILPSVMVTVLITLFAWLVLLRNVSAPIRV
jgi:ABC-type transport system involved in multi-copper enzyme maturation permease subunit